MKTTSIFCVTLAILLAASSGARAAEPILTLQDLFVSGIDNVNIYRIPALIVSPKGSLLAFCEAREGDDGDPTDLVLKRSPYDGRPNQPRQLNGYSRTFGYGVNWLPMQMVLPGKGKAIMQPCPLVDRTTGEILLCCQEISGGLASILRYPKSPQGASALLFCNPPHAGPFEARTNLTVRISYDEGQSWAVSREVNPGPGAYSSLAVLADGATIGLLYETGDSHPYEKISFARFNLEWLIEKPQ